VELITPVEDPGNREQLTDVLDRALADNTHAWDLGADGVWSRLSPDGNQSRDSQAELLRQHARRAEEAAAVRA
jgi:polyphosphate kinase